MNWMPQADLSADLAKLAAYYREILSHLSERAGRHLLDVGAVIRHGLVADVSLFAPVADLLQEETTSFVIPRPAARAIQILGLASAAEDEENELAPEAARKAEGSPEKELEQLGAATRLIAIYRRQEQEPYTRETVLGLPILSFKHGARCLCAPLLYFPVRVDYDPLASRATLRKLVSLPSLNAKLLMVLFRDEAEAVVVRSKLHDLVLSADSVTEETVKKVLRTLGELCVALERFSIVTRDLPLKAALAAREEPQPTVVWGATLVNASRTSPFLQDDLTELTSLADPAVGETAAGVLLTPAAESTGGGGTEDPDAPELPEPLLYPFPSSRAQRRVGRKASRARIMTVQGPPGTGKSQTIANLVCHLVGTGHSVLVTSHQDKALEVVTEKLPDIEYLAMSMGRSERESVQRLISKLDRLGDAGTETPVTGMPENARKQAVRRMLDIERRLHELRARFSQLKALERDRFGLSRNYHELRHLDHIRDQIPAGDLVELLPLLKTLALHFANCLRAWHDLESLFGPIEENPSFGQGQQKAEFCSQFLRLLQHIELLPMLLEHLEDLGSLWAQADPDLHRQLALAEGWAEQHGVEMVGLLRALDLKPRDLPTLLQMAHQFGDGLINTLLEQAAEVQQLASGLLENPASGGTQDAAPAEGEVRALREDWTILNDCRSWLAWYLSPAARTARRRAGEAGFAVRRGSRIRQLGAMHEWLVGWESRHRCQSVLLNHRQVGCPLPEVRVTERPAVLLTAAQTSTRWLRMLSRLVQLPDPAVTGKRPRELLETLLATLESGQARVISDLSRALRVYVEGALSLGERPGVIYQDDLIGPLVDAFRSAVAPPEILQLRERLARVVGAAPDYLELLSLAAHKLAGIPETLESLVKEVRAGTVPSWLSEPHATLEAYRLRRQIQADLLAEPADPHTVASEIRRLDQERIQHILRAIAASRQAVLRQLSRDNVTFREIALLRKLLKRKRKTVSFVELRRTIDYRKILKVLPCWIMGIEDVARVFPMIGGLFDYVIIDEASQCSQAAALHLAFRARRMIVVGDKEQLQNPQTRFLPEGIVANLLLKHGLWNHPHQAFFSARSTSLLELAEFLSDHRDFLDEHFRCEPPIIRWSNERFYANRLHIVTPLRTVRFAPCLRVESVHGADDDPETRVNVREAEVVVDELERIVTDAAWSHLTIGVISPYREQATYIQHLIHERFSGRPDLIKERGIIASTADGFQGDERDIILYSFRFGPSSSPAVVTAIQNERERLNVAFTRARRLAVCFVSTPPAAFPRGLVRDFLEHAYQEQLERRDPLDSQPDQFDSDFERDVCEGLRSRGYSVLTQFPCGPFRIDLVVMDREGRRLAVECDGSFHYESEVEGILREEDYHRQDIIERAGWVVFRVPARRFYHNPPVLLDEVERVLAALEPDRESGDPPVPARTAAETFEAGPESVDEGALAKRTATGRQLTFLDSGSSVQAEPGEAEARSRAHHERRPPREALAEVVREHPELGVGADTALAPDYWMALAKWGKETEELTPQERSLAYNVGKMLRFERDISPKQVEFARRVLSKAIEAGYRSSHGGLPDHPPSVASDPAAEDLVLRLKTVAATKYTMSYKGVLLLSILDCMDSDGTCELDEVARHFMRFYLDRRLAGHPAEKPSSAILGMTSQRQLDLEGVKRVIYQNPLRIFQDNGLVQVSGNRIKVSRNLLPSLKEPAVVRDIRAAVQEALDRYYDGLQS